MNATHGLMHKRVAFLSCGRDDDTIEYTVTLILDSDATAYSSGAYYFQLEGTNGTAIFSDGDLGWARYDDYFVNKNNDTNFTLYFDSTNDVGACKELTILTYQADGMIVNSVECDGTAVSGVGTIDLNENQAANGACVYAIIDFIDSTSSVTKDTDGTCNLAEFTWYPSNEPSISPSSEPSISPSSEPSISPTESPTS